MTHHKWADIKRRHFSPEKIARLKSETTAELRQAGLLDTSARTCSCCGIRLTPDEEAKCYVCSKARATCLECRGCAYVDDHGDVGCNHCGRTTRRDGDDRPQVLDDLAAEAQDLDLGY
jgi:hypothetical protein